MSSDGLEVKEVAVPSVEVDWVWSAPDVLPEVVDVAVVKELTYNAT